MAWVDCMRLRRVATIIRTTGWTVTGLLIMAGALATFTIEGDSAAAILIVLGGASIVVVAVTQALGWMCDKRGDRIVTR